MTVRRGVDGAADGFCTVRAPCERMQGDCDHDDECAGELRCGSNNCPRWMDTDNDCCHVQGAKAILGQREFCSSELPCAAGEGQCASNDQCRGQLVCGISNCASWMGVGTRCCAAVGREAALVGAKGFCTADAPCREQMGPCATDGSASCRGSLICVSMLSRAVFQGLSDTQCPAWLGEGGSCCVAPAHSRPGVLGEAGFCTAEWPCGENHGPCHGYTDCAGELVCGSQNCPAWMAPVRGADGGTVAPNCCTLADDRGGSGGDSSGEGGVNGGGDDNGVASIAPGDPRYCSPDRPCGRSEGGCTAVTDCAAGLLCDTGGGSCPVWMAEGSGCCHEPKHFKADGERGGFCRPDAPCSEMQGHCNGDNECAPGLFCGRRNCPRWMAPARNCCQALGHTHELEPGVYRITEARAPHAALTINAGGVDASTLRFQTVAVAAGTDAEALWQIVPLKDVDTYLVLNRRGCTATRTNALCGMMLAWRHPPESAPGSSEVPPPLILRRALKARAGHGTTTTDGKAPELSQNREFKGAVWRITVAEKSKDSSGNVNRAYRLASLRGCDAGGIDARWCASGAGVDAAAPVAHLAPVTLERRQSGVLSHWRFDRAPTCADGKLHRETEECDDHNVRDGDGCTSNCKVEDGWVCDGGFDCVPVCGDRNVVGEERCDDGNADNGDGCSADCRHVEWGWDCRAGGCSAVCGDGSIVGREACDGQCV